jgi:antitoxin HicB
MGLPYKIEIQPIPEEAGGGFSASLPELGRYAVCGDGETVEEALRHLEEVKKERFRAYLEAGVAIPGPAPDGEQYSGKFVVRIPRSLHRELSLRAKENNVSLNHFVSYLLGTALQREALSSGIPPVRKSGSSLKSCIAEPGA